MADSDDTRAAEFELHTNFTQAGVTPSPMSTDKFVLSYTHLKDRPNADHALQMLQKIASLVKPIMRKHGWVLPVLSEFFPESPNLVGELLELRSLTLAHEIL